MAQRNIVARRRVTYVGLESTFGTTPAGTFPNLPTAGLFLHDDVGPDLQEKMLDVLDESIYRQGAVHPVHGLQSEEGQVALKRYLRATPSANQLTAAGTAASAVDRVLLTHALGAEHAAIGTTVATGTSTTVFDVASAANIKKGTFLAVTISGTPEWCKVTNVSGVTVTVTPPLSGTPAISAVVRNLYTYAPAEQHSNSITVYRGYVADSGTEPEYIVNGVYGGMTFDFPVGQLPTMSFQGAVTSFTGPASSAAIDTATAVADALGAPVVVKSAKLYLATTAIARATSVVWESVTLDFPNAWEKVMDGGAAQAVAGVVNTAGRPRACKITLRLRFDSGSYDNATTAGFGADDVFRFAMVLTAGSGTTLSHWIFEVPRAQLTAKPKLTLVGSRLYMNLELSGIQDNQVTQASETGDDLARILAPYRIAFG